MGGVGKDLKKKNWLPQLALFATSLHKYILVAKFSAKFLSGREFNLSSEAVILW